MTTKYQLLRNRCIELNDELEDLESQFEEIMKQMSSKKNELRNLLIDSKDDFNNMTFMPQYTHDKKHIEYRIIHEILNQEKIQLK